MQCLTGDAITELAMSSLLDEALPAKLREHLDGCPKCQAALGRETQTAAEAVRAIQTADFNPVGPCLSDNDLSEYLEGRADEAADLPRIERHLASCPDCITSLAELDNLILEADSAVSPVRYVVRLAKKGAEILARPDKGFRVSLLEYVPTLKDPSGAQELCAWSQNVDQQPLHFKLQHSEDGKVHLTLSLESRSVDFAATTVTLRKDGDLIQSEALGADGFVRLPNLQRGVYSFEIQCTGELNLRVEIDLQ